MHEHPGREYGARTRDCIPKGEGGHSHLHPLKGTVSKSYGNALEAKSHTPVRENTLSLRINRRLPRANLGLGSDNGQAPTKS